MRTDFENLPELKPVNLHPSDANFLHRVPVQGERHGFLIFCTGSNPADGPDYTMPMWPHSVGAGSQRNDPPTH